MRSDLDKLMVERDINAFFIPGTEGENSQRAYITGGIHASALVVKKQGEQPVLIVSGMEIDEARKSGLEVMTYDDFDLTDIQREHGRGTKKTFITLWKRFFEHFDIQGNITLYGKADLQTSMGMVRTLGKEFKDRIKIVLDKKPDIFTLAAETKDAEELTRLREVGQRTGAVMRAVRDWLSTHAVKDGQVVNAEGKPLTIRDVKYFLRLKLMEYDLEDPGNNTIFAQGRDAGLPHSRGEADDILRPGESIVFDLFPRDIETGYFHDMTRTWSLGHAREDVKRDFDLVLTVFYRSLEHIDIEQPTKNVDRQVSEWFEATGHPTRLSTSNTQEGYVHSLGHGIGLDVHQGPSINQFGKDDIVFRAGHVVTIEPGLYYPDKGYGIRIEDTLYIDENGQLQNLTDCPYDLVVPLNG